MMVVQDCGCKGESLCFSCSVFFLLGVFVLLLWMVVV